jgi:hypothetical protein
MPKKLRLRILLDLTNAAKHYNSLKEDKCQPSEVKPKEEDLKAIRNELSWLSKGACKLKLRGIENGFAKFSSGTI